MAREPSDTTPAIAVTVAPFEVGHVPVEVALIPTADTEHLSAQIHANGRLLLRLSDIQRPGRSGSYDVYANLPPGGRPEDHPDHLAGRVSLFGPASESHQPPRTFNFVLDVSKLRATLPAAPESGHRFRVTVVSANDWSDPVTFGRVSLHLG